MREVNSVTKKEVQNKLPFAQTDDKFKFNDQEEFKRWYKYNLSRGFTCRCNHNF